MPTFIDTDLLDRLRVGPLASHLDAYVERIKQEGFLPSSVPMQMYAIARFSKWLEIRQLGLHRVDEPAVELFLQRDPGVVHGGESAPLRRFLAMLREMGLTAAKPPEPQNCQERLIDAGCANWCEDFVRAESCARQRPAYAIYQLYSVWKRLGPD
jgi:hypothetical protein